MSGSGGKAEVNFRRLEVLAGNGTLSVFAKFHLEAGRIKDVRVYYDTQQLAVST